MSVPKYHYVVDPIAPRHFVESARAAGLGEKIVGSIFEELNDLGRAGVDQLLASLPKSFPDEVAGPIRSGLLKRLGTLDVRTH